MIGHSTKISQSGPGREKSNSKSRSQLGLRLACHLQMGKAVHEAARRGLGQCLGLLLGEGRDVEETVDGLTALHVACLNNRLQCVKLLVAYDADVSVRSIDGKCAAELAASPEVLAALACEGTAATMVEGKMEGYLWKSSGREKNKAKGWQKRWFILHGGTLSYFKNRKVCEHALEIGREIEIGRERERKRQESA